MPDAQTQIKNIAQLNELKEDLAGRYKRTHSTGYEDIAAEVIEADFTALMRDGYVILESLLDEQTIAAFHQAVTPLLGDTGRNSFEGALTQRVYDVFSKARVLDSLAEHPRVLALLDRLFMPNYLLSQAQVINILPGSAAQLLHHDDSSYPIPRPRAPLGAATIWALDDFTKDNGATVVVPGSHTWGQGRQPTADEVIPCVMPAGSAVLFLGTLWHGGGENRSSRARLAATCQYCEPWLRQQENFLLEVAPELAASLSENLRRMIGYSILPPFYGMVNGMHPKRLLEPFKSGK